MFQVVLVNILYGYNEIIPITLIFYVVFL